MDRASRPGERNAELAARIIERVDTGSPLKAVHTLGEGVKSCVLRLELESGESLALKLYCHDVAEREQTGYRHLAEHDLPVPRLIAAAGPGAPENEMGWTLMTMVGGRGSDELRAELALDDELKIHRLAGGFLRRLHQVPCPSFGRSAGECSDLPDNGSWVRRRFRAALDEFGRLGGDAQLAGQIEEMLESRHDVLDECSTPVFCHGDLHAANIRVAPLGHDFELCGVIDLEHCFAGDPVMDLAFTWAARSPHDPAVWDALLEGYGDVPWWMTSVLDLYVVLAELELWGYFAGGGSSDPLPEIEERIRAAVDPYG